MKKGHVKKIFLEKCREAVASVMHYLREWGDDQVFFYRAWVSKASCLKKNPNNK